MSRHTFKDNWPAPNEYLIELGRITTVWGALESSVNIAISKLAGYESTLDPRAIILIAHSNFQQRVDVVSSLCEHLSPRYPRLNGHKSVIKLIRLAQKARNKYAHNGITVDERSGDVIVTYATARGVLKTSVERVEITDLQEVSAKIHEALCALHTLITGHEIKPFWER